jgi:YHS domain-containing protein
MSTKSKFVFITITLFAFFITGLVMAEEAVKEKKPQTLDPITGKEINKEFFKEFQGQKIYFSAADSIAAFEKDPEAAFKKIEEENVLLENVQKTCPVMGGEINKDFFKDYKGRRIYFCMADCVKKFDENPDEYLKKLETPVKAEEKAKEEPKKEEPKPAEQPKTEEAPAEGQ